MKNTNINKENFFNVMMKEYPDATQRFCDWIDNYKSEVGWINLFYDNGEEGIKFHDIPYEMQKGIIERFVKETTNQDIICFTKEGLLRDFTRILEHLQDKANLKAHV